MSDPTTQTLIVKPGPTKDSVLTDDRRLLRPPTEWELLPPGDPGLTRRVKSGGPSWTVQEKVGRKLFSRGVWAPRSVITAVRAVLEFERSDPKYEKKLAAAAKKRQAAQAEYVEDFTTTVRDYLAFHARHAELADRLAAAIAAHATPVGSGTVARTQRIPIEERAEAAVIAWMRHQTTAYDTMVIPRVKGKRREVRRMLAQRSKALLQHYRAGTLPEKCPLTAALNRAG